jgi:hypothetical protein
MKLVSIVIFLAALSLAIFIGPSIESFSFANQLVYFSPTFYLLYVFFKGPQRYLSFAFFCIFYSLGYVVYLYVLYLTLDGYSGSGWQAVNLLLFKQKYLTPLVASSSLIMLGIFAGCTFFQIFIRIKKTGFSTRIIDVSHQKLKNFLNLWFVSAFCVLIIMSLLGVARTGLKDATSLPFGLRGLLFYLRNLSLPSVGVYLFVTAVDSGSTQLVRKAGLYLALFTLTSSLLFFSRSDVVLILVPSGLYLFGSKNESIKRLGRFLFLTAIAIGLLILQLVQVLRNLFYGSGGSIDASQIVGDLISSDFNELSALLLELFTYRQGGARDMSVVLDSTYNNVAYVWNYFWQINEQYFSTDVWGFDDTYGLASGDNTFGAGFLGMSWFAFGSNFLVITLMSFMTGFFCAWVEDFFVRRKQPGLQIYFSFYLTFAIWNTFLWGRLWRFVIVFLLTTWIIDRIASGLRLKYPLHGNLDSTNRGVKRA